MHKRILKRHKYRLECHEIIATVLQLSSEIFIATFLTNSFLTEQDSHVFFIEFPINVNIHHAFGLRYNKIQLYLKLSFRSSEMHTLPDGAEQLCIKEKTCSRSIHTGHLCGDSNPHSITVTG